MIYLFGGVGVIVLLLTVALGFEHERVVYETNRAVKAELTLKAAQDRATALALLWSAQVDKSEAEVNQAKDEANVQIAALQDRIKKLPSRIVVFSTPAASVLDDATAAANAAPAPAVDNKPAPPVPDPAIAGATTAYDEREFADYVTRAAQAYRDVRTKLGACISFYQNLQKEAQ